MGTSVLNANTRLALSVSLLVFAYAGLKISDSLQETYPDEMPVIVSKPSKTD